MDIKYLHNVCTYVVKDFDELLKIILNFEKSIVALILYYIKRDRGRGPVHFI